jgi:hypothetical protein
MSRKNASYSTVRIGRPDAISHNFSPFEPVMARSRPFGDKAALSTSAKWPTFETTAMGGLLRAAGSTFGLAGNGAVEAPASTVGGFAFAGGKGTKLETMRPASEAYCDSLS